MFRTLSGLKILVTRPQLQAYKLCSLIEKNGGEAISFPVIEILAEPISTSLIKKFQLAESFDFVIFISKNAVNISFDYYFLRLGINVKNINFVAIGEGTQRELLKYEINNIICIGKQGNSEALLSLKEFSSQELKGKQVLIIRGIGGRELLMSTLVSRGAKVDYLEVYKRSLPKYNIEEKRAIWQNGRPNIIIITSSEGLNNLLALTEKQDRASLFMTPVVVMSDRVACFAKEKGFAADIKIANEMTDSGLIKATIDIIGNI